MVILSCKQFSLVVFHSYCKTVLHSLIYHSENYFLHSILFHFSFFFRFRSFIFQILLHDAVNINDDVLISFLALFDTTAFKTMLNPPKVSVKSVLESIEIATVLAMKSNYGENLSQGIEKEICAERFSVLDK